MSIVLKKELREQVDAWTKQKGFQSEDDFVNWAVEQQLRELRKEQAFETAARVKEALSEQGITEAQVMEDLEKFCRELPDPH